MAKYVFEPATGLCREVVAAAGGPGTGLNDGDWEWQAPAAYKSPVYLKADDDILFTGSVSFGGTAATDRLGLATTIRFVAMVSSQILAGAFTINGALNEIEAQGGPGADDLDTLSVGAGAAGDVLFFIRVKAGSTITIKNGTGNIQTGTGADVVAAAGDVLIFLLDAAGTAAVLVGGAAGGGGGGGGNALLDGSVHTDTQATVPADGDVVIADGGGYTVASAPGGGAATYLQSPAGGGTAAFAQGAIGDFVAAAGAGHDTVGVGGVVAYLGAPPAGWAFDAAMNAGVPLPPGYGWWIKL